MRKGNTNPFNGPLTSSETNNKDNIDHDIVLPYNNK